jgi:hypothetical protein
MARVPQEPVDMTAALRKLPAGAVDMTGGMQPEGNLEAGDRSRSMGMNESAMQREGIPRANRSRSAVPAARKSPVDKERRPSQLIVPDEFWPAMNPRAVTSGWLREYSRRWAAAGGQPQLGTLAKSVGLAAGFPGMGFAAGGPIGPTAAQKMVNSAHFKAVGQSGCCEPLPVKTRAIDIANLAKVCRIDLGECKMYNGVLDFDGRLWAEVDCDFQPSSNHGDFLRLMLPEWSDGISNTGWDDTWERATKVLQKSTFNDVALWTSPGLYWTQKEGFIFRALRYAIATLYGWASRADDISVFAKSCLTDKRTIRARIDSRTWRVRLDEMCEFDDVHFTIDSHGALTDLTRIHKGLYLAISISQATGLNDGLHIMAALADYHFWWSIRLYDWVRQGRSTRPFQDLVVSIQCARAALSEIVELASVLLHEIGHTMAIPDTWWECQYLGNKMDCCHFQLEWYFRHRLCAEFALPLPLMADCSEFRKFPSATDGTGERDRFDFDTDEGWEFEYSFNPGGRNFDACEDSFNKGVHASLWTTKHKLTVSWQYPQECESDDDATGSQTFNG